MFNRERLLSSLRIFPERYLRNFNDFWKWKNKIESMGESILDEPHFESSYLKLEAVLNKWQTYRNSENINTSKTLKEALSKIQNEYYQIKNYSLLSFSNIPKNKLEVLWHELGRVKEREGQKNKIGKYYAIATTKPLLLLWGQTPAFDTRVRKNLPNKFGISAVNYKVSFQKWYDAMKSLSNELEESTDVIQEIHRISKGYYGDASITPYGRFLDIYFWV